jgi:hypothetical protein
LHDQYRQAALVPWAAEASMRASARALGGFDEFSSDVA